MALKRDIKLEWIGKVILEILGLPEVPGGEKYFSTWFEMFIDLIE